MTREVTHTEHGPDFFDEEDIEAHGGDIAICRCGLTADRPFCDGSHKATEDEEDGVRYKYENDDSDGPRHRISEILFEDEAE